MAKKKTTPSLDLSPAKVQAIVANWDGEGAKEFQLVFDQVKGTAAANEFFNACVEALTIAKLTEWNKTQAEASADEISLIRLITLKESELNKFRIERIERAELMFGEVIDFTASLKAANPTLKGYDYAIMRNKEYHVLAQREGVTEAETVDFIADGVALCKMEESLERLKQRKPSKYEGRKLPTKKLIALFADFLKSEDLPGYPEFKIGSRTQPEYCNFICDTFDFPYTDKIRQNVQRKYSLPKFSNADYIKLMQHVFPTITASDDLKKTIKTVLENKIKPADFRL